MLAICLSPVYLLLHAYLLHWLLRWLGAFHPVLRALPIQTGAGAVYTAAVFTILLGFLLPKGRARRITRRMGNEWLGITLYLALTVLTADAVRVALRHSGAGLPVRLRWITDLRAAGALCAALVLFLCLVSEINAHLIRTTTYEVTVQKPCPGHSELKLVLAADLHIGDNIGCAQMRRMVRAINAQKPDLVVFAGDIFDNEFDALEDEARLVAILHGIRSRYGVYACYGNHDIDERILAGFTFDPHGEKTSDPRMDAFLEKAGIRLLCEEGVEAAGVQIYGRPDAERPGRGRTGRRSPAEIAAGLDMSRPVFVLDHQPRELQELADAGVDLDLSGHTHGGQMFPANLTVNALWENPCGMLRKGSMTSIVTSGVGLFGPCMRTGSRAEVCAVRVRFAQEQIVRH